MRMRNKVTITDVAEHAGVSVATVSYVLNKNKNKTISEKTREKVFESARMLNYISNSAAKALQSRKTNCIGVVIDTSSFLLQRHAYTIHGVYEVLRENSYNIMLCSIQNEQDGYSEYLDAYYSNRIDGIIYLSSSGKTLDPSVENMVIERGIPFVAYDCEPSRMLSSVDIDYFTGAYDMTKHLYEKGSRKLFYVRPMFDDRQEREREQGVRKAAFDCKGMELNVLELNLSKDRLGFYPAYNKLLKENIHRFDEDSALICSWSGGDQISLQVLMSEGLNIPIATLAQGAIDTRLFSNLYYSYIPNIEIGRTCARSILQILNDGSKIVHEVVTPTLERIEGYSL